MHAQVFARLVDELHELEPRFVSLEEQLAIFLYMSATGLTIRHAGERFQRWNETVLRYVNSPLDLHVRLISSGYFCKMVIIFSSAPFYTSYVHMPAPDADQTEMHNNPRFFPYFKNVIGALDGSHIHAAPASRDRAAFRNRKGFLSQNCLFAYFLLMH